MKRLLIFLGLFSFLLTVTTSAEQLVSLGSYSVEKALEGIEKDFEIGKISFDQKALYQIYAIFLKDELPDEYQITGPKDFVCGTPIILEVKRNWEKLSLQTQAKISLILARPTRQYYYDTPEGHFKIHYNTSGEYPVYNPGEDINPADGIPDYINRVAEYMERAWSFEIDSLGYDAPPSDGTLGGDLRYDVYIREPFGFTVPEDSSGQYPGRWCSYTSYVIIGNDLRIGRYPDDPLPFLKATTAHEFFHSCQMAYNACGWTEDYTSWLFESGSNWIEEYVWDDLNDVYYYFNSLYPVPEKSLYYENGRHMYASWVWGKFLEERYNIKIIKEIWLQYINTYGVAACDSVLKRYGSDVNAEFKDYSVWNWITNYRDDGNHFSEASFFPDTVVNVAQHQTYPVSSTISLKSPESLGANYIAFNNLPSGDYLLTFSGDTLYPYGIKLILDKGGKQYDFQEVFVDSLSKGEAVIDSLEKYRRITMVVSHLFNLPEKFSFARYSYSLVWFGGAGISRGDVNYDLSLSLSDVIYLANYLLKNGPSPQPSIYTGDLNCDRKIELTDAIFLANYILSGGDPPCQPLKFF